jgi:hypothetical protein
LSFVTPMTKRIFLSLVLLLGVTIISLGNRVVNRSLGSAPWSVSNPSGLTACYEADTAGSYVTPNPITSWADTSATNLALVATSAASPVFVDAQINGKPIARFTNDDSLATASAQTGSTWFGATNLTIFAVISTSSNSLNPLFSWEPTPSTNTVHSYLSYTDDTLYFRAVADAEAVTASEPVGWHTGYHLVELTRDGTGSGSSIVVDGVSIGTGTISSSLNTAATAKLILGETVTAVTTSGWIGDLASLLIYNRTLTADEKTTVRTYLNTKYGL